MNDLFYFPVLCVYIFKRSNYPINILQFDELDFSHLLSFSVIIRVTGAKKIVKPTIVLKCSNFELLNRTLSFFSIKQYSSTN